MGRIGGVLRVGGFAVVSCGFDFVGCGVNFTGCGLAAARGLDRWGGPGCFVVFFRVVAAVAYMGLGELQSWRLRKGYVRGDDELGEFL